MIVADGLSSNGSILHITRAKLDIVADGSILYITRAKLKQSQLFERGGIYGMVPGDCDGRSASPDEYR